MQLFAFGINHESAPLAVREQASFLPERLPEALADLRARGDAAEAAILSTCNRTELYCGMEADAGPAILDWLCEWHAVPEQRIKPFFYAHHGADAVKHTFRVASGLDSMVLGEPQILGQMKDAFAAAHKHGATGQLLNRLFQRSFAVAKQVRTDTAVGASAVSVAYAAVRLARQIFNDLSEQTVLLIGAGQTIELTARHLREQHVKRILVANRTVERAQHLAGSFGAEAISLGELSNRLAEADIIVSSTASQLPILGKGAVEQALKARKHRPVFMIDIAVPRDIEAQVAELNDVYLYTIDDLKEVVEANMESRREAAREAESIIELQVVDFMRWLDSLEAVPTIRSLRSSAAALADAEVLKARRQLAAGADVNAVIQQLARSLTNKITHAPTSVLRSAARDGNDALLDAARRLFQLSDD